MGFGLRILGCSSATPKLGAHPTSQYLKIAERHFLIDCGEGSQLQLQRYGIRPNRIDHIFISHLHGDHFFGLPGLISSYHLLNRGKPLHIFAPHGLREVLHYIFRHSNTWLSFELEIHPLDFSAPRMIWEDDKVMVTSVPLKHSVPTCGFVFKEKTHPRKLLINEVRSHNIPVYAYHRIKQGEDWIDDEGKIITNSKLTSDGPAARSYAFCSDTAYAPEIVDQLRGVDLLYHESTFLDEDERLARKTQHSTASDAAQIAVKADVKQLLLGHYSPRYKDQSAFVEQASEHFSNTLAAYDGLLIEKL